MIEIRSVVAWGRRWGWGLTAVEHKGTFWSDEKALHLFFFFPFFKKKLLLFFFTVVVIINLDLSESICILCILYASINKGNF